jgi:hypothetical protein
MEAGQQAGPEQRKGKIEENPSNAIFLKYYSFHGMGMLLADCYCCVSEGS